MQRSTDNPKNQSLLIYGEFFITQKFNLKILKFYYACIVLFAIFDSKLKSRTVEKNRLRKI